MSSPPKETIRFPRNSSSWLLVLAVSLTTGLLPAADSNEKAKNQETTPVAYDELTGMRIAPGWEQVRNNCIACHSAQQFLQQSGSRNTWDSIIVWMQQSAGLWPLEPEIRSTILDYLVEFHGPKDATRRPPIPANLLPPNPYAKQVKTGK